VYTFAISGYAYGKNVGKSMTTEKPSREVTIELASDASLGEIAAALREKGVIDNTIVFQLDCYVKGYKEKFPAGTYILNANMDTNEILSALSPSNSVTADIQITIPEGYSIEDIVSSLSEKEVVTAEDFKTALDGAYDYTFLKNVPDRENRLEGYLFPDTYRIAPSGRSEQIINKMLTRFGEIYDSDFTRREKVIGVSMDDAIIIASIIEKEVFAQATKDATDANRAKLSAVIPNRLKDELPIEMPSTVSYFSDRRSDMLTSEELSEDSPYNTFLYPGLPKGPICNPGEASIRAALYPEEGSDILYFKSYVEKGVMLFAETEEALEELKNDLIDKE
jgi:UPF0755 protein